MSFLVVADWFLSLTFLTSGFFQVLFPLLSPRSGLLFSPPPHSSCGCFLLILGIWLTLERSFLESKELNNTDCAVTRGWMVLVYKEAYLSKEPLSPLPPCILDVLLLFSSSPCIIPFSLQVFAQLLLSEGGLPLPIYLKCKTFPYPQAHTHAHTHTHSLFPVPALFIVCLLPARV